MNQAIELRHLRHFVALAEEQHFGRAARRCNISQPPFSVSIQQLEQALGFALVERSPQGVRLTAAGAAYYNEAQKALAQVEQATHVAARVYGGMEGVLKVGFLASMLPRGMDRAVRRFLHEYPEVELQLVELSSAEQIQALQRRQVHYAFVHSNVLPSSFCNEVLLRERFMLCLPDDFPGADRPDLRLLDIKNEHFVLFGRNYSPTYYDQVISICVEAGFHPDVRHEARHWLTVMSCVARGLGITLVPVGLSRAGVPGLRFLDVVQSPIISVVRGAWLEEDGDNRLLALWRQVVAATWPEDAEGQEAGMEQRTPERKAGPEAAARISG
jgi:DNA-binding transcriptional LysR family regulator